MAPHIEQGYHSRGNPVRYALRAFRQKENNRLQPRGTELSEKKRKENFFYSLGLQAKRPRSEMLNKNLIKSISVPSGVILRECSVIILGVKCSLCYKCFKCKTDLNFHYKLKHEIDIQEHEIIRNERETVENGIDRCRETSQSLNLARRDTGKTVEINTQEKVIVILKIGDEIVGRKPVKRKHFKRRKTNAFAQSEVYRENELITNEDSYENCIDLRRYCDSPCQCCDSCVYAAKSSNRYSVSNNVATERVLREESVAEKENDDSRGTKESREVSCTLEDCRTIGYFPEQTALFGTTKILPSAYNTESTNVSKVLIVPLILPVSVPDKNPEKATVELMIQSTPVHLHFQQNHPQGTERQREQHQEEQQEQVPNQQRREQQKQQQEEQEGQRLGRTLSTCTEDNSYDIQDVLIIGGKQKTEFNHESPTRVQQEKLFYSTVEVMMEKQASPSRANKKIDSPKRKKAMNGDANDQCAKEKSQRFVMNSNEEKLSSMKHIASYSDTVKTCASNNGKENLMHNKNIDVSTEMLHCTFNYCNQVHEINNNTGCVQGPLSRFHVSSFKGTENIPILIDLVNDE